MRYFKNYELNRFTEYPSRHTLTEEEIIEMGQRWDPQPFHVDAELAKDSMFGGLVASSSHLFCIACRLGNDVPDEMRSAAESALGFEKLQWHAPARPGDTLRVTSTVIERRESNSRPHLGIVTCDNHILNQRDEVVFSYQGAFLVRKEPSEADAE
ncbi:MAG: MaoC family dehydratase N-terminal domain-containing protein [Pseudomonadota bacterium]